MQFVTERTAHSFQLMTRLGIQVGKPGVALQTGVRNKPSLAPEGIEYLCLDHDYDGTSIVPSVYLRHNVPEKVSGDWYHGKVSIGLKDGVFQKSCPWRHAEELSRNYLGYRV